MSKSIFEREYNKSNLKQKKEIVIYQDVHVNYIDILKQIETKVLVKDYVDCLCKSSVNLKDYFVVCKKCNGKGTINLNNHELICNVCKGEKYTRVCDCYACNNEGKILKDSYITIKLNNKIKDGDELVYDNDDYKLVLKVKIDDKDKYLIKDNDIFFLESIKYSKEDFKNKVNKEIKTFKGKRYLKSNFEVKKEIVKIENEGIENGDFYFIFENEVELEQKVIYTNVLIDKCGYVDLNELINNEVVIAKKIIPLNFSNYIYIDDTVSEYLNDEYRIILNKFNLNEFEIDNDISYVINLDKEDLSMDKKYINLNDEKININFKKNLKEVLYVDIINKGFVNKEGKKKGIKVKINPYFENTYKISIKKNKATVYVEDYKYYDYRLVEVFKNKDYLSNYIQIDHQEYVYINNDLVLIKRV